MGEARTGGPSQATGLTEVPSKVDGTEAERSVAPANNFLNRSDLK